MRLEITSAHGNGTCESCGTKIPHGAKQLVVTEGSGYTTREERYCIKHAIRTVRHLVDRNRLMLGILRKEAAKAQPAAMVKVLSDRVSYSR